jgi:hypothetical protein
MFYLKLLTTINEYVLIEKRGMINDKQKIKMPVQE